MLNSAWFNKEKTKKQERDHRRELEDWYNKLLHGNISDAINSATQKIEKTLYKIEVKHNFSSIEVFITHQNRKIESLLNLHFKLRACHNGVFLMYGVRIKAQSNSSSTDSMVLYSKPELISDHTQEDTVLEWIKKAV